jgi:hypothetical protein
MEAPLSSSSDCYVRGGPLAVLFQSFHASCLGTYKFRVAAGVPTSAHLTWLFPVDLTWTDL